MSLEEIFKDRVSFKKGIIDGIQIELDQFGLKVFNANIKELEDAHGSEYFSYMRQKTRSLAENEAKINIADANNKGAIGQAQKESETRITTANITSRTIIAENEQKQTVLNSNTQFQLAQIEQETRLKMSRVTQDQEIQKKNLDLERQVEEVRQQKRLEELRASKGTDAQIAYEIVQKETDAEVYKQQKIAEARLYNQLKEAEGITLLANSQKKALEEYAKVFKDDHSLLTYAMMERGLFTEMAEVNAKAINGLNPQITVWNTGAAGEGSDPFGSFRSIFQAIPPVLSTVQAQTGIQPPSWMGTVPQNSGKREK
jgi:flotillin